MSRALKLVERIQSFLNTDLRYSINEASINRVWQHLTSDRAFAMITSFRSEYVKTIDGSVSEKENYKRLKALEKDIRDAGYGYFKIEGHYPEERVKYPSKFEIEYDDRGYAIELSDSSKEKAGITSNEIQRKEISLFVIDHNDSPRHFQQFMCMLGLKYKQDSIFFKDSDGQCYFIYTKALKDHFKGQKELVSNKILSSPENMEKYFSKVKGIPFTFKPWGEVYEHPRSDKPEWDKGREVNNKLLRKDPDLKYSDDEV